MIWNPFDNPSVADWKEIPCTHGGSEVTSFPYVASRVRSNAESDSNCKAYEKDSSTSSVPVEISLVKPANTELIDLPKSENPPMKKATPESP